MWFKLRQRVVLLPSIEAGLYRYDSYFVRNVPPSATEVVRKNRL